MKLKLVKLTKNDYDKLKDMLEEWMEDQRVNGTNHSPYAIFRNDYKDFDYYLEHLENKVETAEKVPDSVYFCLDEDRDIFVGAVNIRHKLNESLLHGGGHIGDGVRPSERRKGVATIMVGLALEKCKELGITNVLMCCDKDNIGSKKSIIRNGGVFDKEYEDDGSITQDYWIRL